MRQPQAKNCSRREVPPRRRRPGREEEARRDTHLGPAPEVAPPVLGGVLHGHQGGPAPLAADAETLDDAQQHEQQRGQDAYLLERRHETDQKRRYAHHVQREDEHRLAAELVAEVSEDQTSQGRATKPTAKVATDERVAASGLNSGLKNKLAEDQGGSVP